MTEEIREIINETVDFTVLKLRAAGIIKDNKKNAYEKTEELLKNYPSFKRSEQPYTIKIVKTIEAALKTIQEDCYFEIIPMAYFENASREDIANYFGITVTTVSRNKNRLVERLSVELFSDDVIFEIFL